MSVGINANLIYASIRDRNQNQAALEELDPDVYNPEEYASGAQADGDYLKSIIDKYEKKGIAGMGFSGGASGTPAFGSAASMSSSPAPITVSVPAAYGSESASMSFDAFA